MKLFFITYPQRFDALKNCYTPIWSDTYSEARQEVFDTIGPAFAFMYEGEDELQRQMEQFGLYAINLSEAKLLIDIHEAKG